MEKLDYYTRLKLQLVALSVELIENEYDILLMIGNYPWIVNDDNLKESLAKLITIDNENNSNIKNMVDYIKKLDETGNPFFPTDLIDEYEYINDNMNLQNNYIDNMIGYIDYSSDFDNCWDDVEDFCDYYIEKDDEIFNQVQVNHSLIKSIREERGN